jgi:hypothetical protein
MERASGSKTPSALSLPVPPRNLAGWPATCVFVTVIETRRYPSTSTQGKGVNLQQRSSAADASISAI